MRLVAEKEGEVNIHKIWYEGCKSKDEELERVLKLVEL